MTMQATSAQDAAGNMLIRETLRYLGIRRADFSALPAGEQTALLDRVSAALKTLAAETRPRFASRIFPLVLKEGMVCFAEEAFFSRDLTRNLSGCTEVCLLAATLGAEADRLIRRAAVRSAAEAALYQGAAAALTEEYVGRVNETLAKEAAGRGLCARPRFSPGFGDCSLKIQKIFFRQLDLPKTLGITLTDGLLMVPEKSVTAFIGLFPEGGETPGSTDGIAKTGKDLT